MLSALVDYLRQPYAVQPTKAMQWVEIASKYALVVLCSYSFWALVFNGAHQQCAPVVLSPWKVTIFTVLFYGPFPLSTIVVANAVCIYGLLCFSMLPMTFEGNSPTSLAIAIGSLFGKGCLFMGFCELNGALAGYGLTLYSKWSPMIVKHCVYFATRYQTQLTLACINRLPKRITLVLGFCYTVLCETSLLFAVPYLLSSVASLKMAGENFYQSFTIKENDNAYEESQSTSSLFLWNPKSTQLVEHVVVLIHGNRFNESQYLLGKNLLESRRCFSSVLKKTVVLTVNYFGGDSLREHTRDTISVRSCTELVLQQVLSQLQALQINRSKVNFVLIGHSLGGIVAAYLNEYYASQERMRIKRVITISAPFKGSFALKSYGWRPDPSNPNLRDDMYPESPVLEELRRKMHLNRLKYVVFGGEFDILVKPSSSLPKLVLQKNRIYFPHLGHYNIKLCGSLWFHIFEIIESSLSKPLVRKASTCVIG